MTLLNRERLLQKEDLEIRKVDLGNGEYVFVRQMTGKERDNFEQSLIHKFTNKKGKPDYETKLDNFRSKLAVNVICDEKGDSLLKPGDFEKLSTSMSAYRLEKIVNTAQKINNISEEDKEELVKNSGGVQGADSSSASAEN